MADATLTQTLIDKIFGLYDISISCQGTKQEILFKNIIDGHKFESELDALIEKTDLKDISQKEVVSKKEMKTHERLEGFTAKYKQDLKRALVVPLGITFSFFILLSLVFAIIAFSSRLNSGNQILIFGSVNLGISFFIFIIMVPIYLIKAIATKYELTQESVKEKFDFITSKHREFSLDKITGVVFTESIIDKIFGTASIDFWSIGSSTHITFMYVKKTDDLYNNILKITCMEDKKKIYSIHPKFSFAKMFKAGIIAYVLFFFNLIISLFLVLVNFWFVILSIFNFLILFFIYINTQMYYKDANLDFYESFVKCEKGWLIHRQSFAHYKHIQDTKTVKYPLSSFGKVVFNVSGESGQQTTGANTKYATTFSNTISFEYISDIKKKHTLFDLILYDVKYAKHADQILQKINEYEEKPVMQTKPDVANAVFPAILFSILGLIGIPFLPIIIIITHVYVKSKTYYLTTYRVYLEYGIIYKRKISILFKKIDHLNTRRGFLNKLLNNGTIVVNTRGSNKPELIIENIKDYDAFFKELEKSY